MDEYINQIERIKVKLTIAKKKDRQLKVFGANRHEYVISRPASEVQIKNFENRYGIELPQSYKSFVSRVGNGGISAMNSGAGPYYGIFPLGSHLSELTDYPEDFLSKDCILHPDMTDDEWKELIRKIEENEEISDADFDIERGKIFGGILPIGSQGCTFIHGLVINGPNKGRVLNLDIDYQKPQFTFEENFLDWYERWLDEVILGKLDKSPSWFGYIKRDFEVLSLDSLEAKPKRSFKFWK